MSHRLTRNTLGTAAEKILAGNMTTAQIDDAIADCHWCRNPSIPNACWHQAAKVLLARGLFSDARVTRSPSSDQLGLFNEKAPRPGRVPMTRSRGNRRSVARSERLARILTPQHKEMCPMTDSDPVDRRCSKSEPPRYIPSKRGGNLSPRNDFERSTLMLSGQQRAERERLLDEIDRVQQDIDEHGLTDSNARRIVENQAAINALSDSVRAREFHDDVTGGLRGGRYKVDTGGNYGDDTTRGGPSHRTPALRAPDRSVHDGTLHEDSAEIVERLIEVGSPSSRSWSAKWAAATGDPNYLSAFSKN